MSISRLLPYMLVVGAAASLYVAAPEWMPLASRIATLAIFVMSLDLVVGYCGLVSLGHSALWGIGGYTAAFIAVRGFSDPLLGLAVGAAAGCAVAFVSGAVLLRFIGLPFIVLTIAFGQVVLNLASKFQSITGGDDGLSGFTVGRLFGAFEFDLEGRVAFLYSIAVLVCCMLLLRMVVRSPFGSACRGIEQNRTRMEAIGASIQPTLLTAYCVAGLFAGLAGALSTQINQVIGLDSLGFALSADALVMLVLGGVGTLFGGLVGAVFFTVVHHTAATMNPYHWLFVIGGLLMAATFIPREAAAAWFSKRVTSGFASRAQPRIA
ncbi:branched-chain amino acid ABC transporter permease [Bradyrhizobium sp. 14AA]